MRAPNFNAILDIPITQIERPKPLPKGAYVVRVKGHPEMVKAKTTGNDGVKFTFEFIQAGDEIDQEAITAAGGIKGKTISSPRDTTFWITDGSAWRLRVFFEETLELPLEEDGQPLSARQLMPMSVGKTFWVKIGHQNSERDPNQTYMTIEAMAPISQGTGDDSEDDGEADGETGGEFDE